MARTAYREMCQALTSDVDDAPVDIGLVSEEGEDGRHHAGRGKEDGEESGETRHIVERGEREESDGCAHDDGGLSQTYPVKPISY